MTALESLLSRPRVVLAAAVLLALSGVLAWNAMPRQEDPVLPDFWGQVIVLFPGADSETVERLVVEPVEERLVEVDEVKTFDSMSRAGIAIFEIELVGGVDDIDEAWDDVQESLDQARADFPSEAGTPVLNRDLNEQESIVLALTGSADPMVLRDAAERLERHLLTLPGVGRTTLVGDPGEQITIELDDGTARRLGIDSRDLAARLASRNQVLPGGTIEVGGKQVTLRPRSEFTSLEEIAGTPLLLPSGAAIPLGEIADVRRGPVEPATERMRFLGKTAVGVGIVPLDGSDVQSLGGAIRGLVDERRAAYAPLEIHEMAFQPYWVESRISGLGRSLLVGILIVASVLVAVMGIRLGLVVASVVPLVALSALGIYGLGGGVLHQMSVAAVVIALGMLVDNAIVVAENVQASLDAGVSRNEAATAAVRELAVPLAAATGTTLAAFVPMLASEGPTGEFTRAIPIIVMLTLTVSYLFAILVTPVLSRRFLRPSPASSGGRGAFAERLAGLAIRRPGWILAGAGLLVAGSLVASSWVGGQFFPESDRNSMVIDLELPEGAHLDETDAASRKLERALLERPEVEAVSSFLGRSVPHFYYNLPQVPQAPNLAQVVVTTDRKDQVGDLVAWTRDFVRNELPGVETVARRIEQGPPVNAPVEIKMTGQDLVSLEIAASRVVSELRSIPGAIDVRHDLGVGSPTVWFSIDDAAAARHGVTRADVASALFGRTRGLRVGQFRSGDDPVPVVVRSSAGERFPASNLEGVHVSAPGRDPVPLAQVARLEVSWGPAAIRHHDRDRVVHVFSQVEEGTAYNDILAELTPRLETMELPDGIAWTIGGSAEGSGDANGALVAALPLGLLLLLGILLVEFNSFRRVGIVLATVPLAAAGIVPGLLAGGQPFGFMSLLGVIALVGVVVNNAIVLLDVVERRRRDGASISDALKAAVERRTRPILLTTATTVAGLLPLALSPSSLWPPMAWAMISGLLASTTLTLLVVPALYLLLFSPRHVIAVPRLLRGRSLARATTLLLLASVLAAGLARAGEPSRLTLPEALDLAVSRPLAAAARDRAAAAGDLAAAERRAGLFPSALATFDVTRQDSAQEMETPIGTFPLSEKQLESTSILLVQPILDPVRTLYTARAARREADAALLSSERVEQEAAALAADAFLTVLAIDAATESTLAFAENLRARLRETDALVREGRKLEADSLKVRLTLEGAEQDLLVLRENRAVAVRELGRAVGMDTAVEPSWNGHPSFPPTPNLDTAVATALRNRKDLSALRQRSDALDLRRKGVRAEFIPRVEARAGWSQVNGNAFQEAGVTTVTLGLVWRPLAAGTRSKRASALASEASALRADYVEARRGIELQVRDALASITIAEGAVRVGERGVEQATETVRVENERYRAGRITTNELLEAEVELRRQRTRRDIAYLEVVRGWVQLDLATGGSSF